MTRFLFALIVVSCSSLAKAEIRSSFSVQQNWGTVHGEDRTVVIRVESPPQKNMVEFPRLNNRMDTVKAIGQEVELKLWPEIETWQIKLPKKLKLPAEIRVTLIEPLRLCDAAFVVKPSSDGEIMLPAHHAITHGEKLRFEPQPHKNTIGYWTVESDWAEWHFTVAEKGEYECEILQGCGKNNGGSNVDVVCIKAGETEGKTVPFVVKETGHFQNFVPVKVGAMALSNGRYRLEVRPTKKANKAVCDIRQIRLTRKR